jgi:alpha-tubulin suppressor-like RCC1 family protein
VRAGGFHTCGIRTNGNLACWGQNGFGQATPPGGAFTELSAGGRHTCGMRANGSAACWGDNGSGQATPPPGFG